jgi:predicted dehydrogenase
LQPARQIPGVEVVAVAARDTRRARKFAAKHEIPRVHASYDALLADPEIDAIYNPLPNSHHCEWSVRALEAGKHVLCEKPLAANAEEAERMRAAAQRAGRVLAEAFHWRYHPLAARMAEIVSSGELGRLRRVEASLCFPLPLPNDIRWQFDLAGGALMDAGCYPVSIVRFLVGSEPEVVSAKAKLASQNVDRLMEIELRFPNEVAGFVRASMLSAHVLQLSASVYGDGGEMHVLNPIMPHLFYRFRVRGAGGRRLEKVTGSTSYQHQLRAFRDWVQGGAPMPTDGAHGVANMKVIDAAYAAAGLPRRGA